MQKVKELPLVKALKKEHKTEIAPERFNLFKTELAKLLKELPSLATKKGTNDQESEEHYKNSVINFLKDIGYKPDYYINTHKRIDLAIYDGKDSNCPLAVLFELKSPTNRSEMITADNLNKKALQELVYYYLQERITHGNLAVKHLIITNGHEWFLFDAQEFERIFVKNTTLKKRFEEFKARKLSITKTDDFYKEVIAPFIEKTDDKIECVHFNLDEYKDTEDESALIALYKILSPKHLLKISVTNDSNALNEKFYNELLYILGLTETGSGKQKKTIERCPAKTRQNGALIEEIIAQLDEYQIRQLGNQSQYGNTEEEQRFNIALELVISWINRILFLKLLEAQLILYHSNPQRDESYSFLSTEKIESYHDLRELFFDVLAKKPDERNQEVKEKFEKVPYLNSTLFEPTELELKTIQISNLKGKPLPFFSQTVLTNEKKQHGKFGSLEYLLKFLGFYNFGREEKDKFQNKDRLVNASVLGLIFEKINGYKDGSHFTPGFITEYMCRESIRPAVVQKFNEAYNWDCKEFKELYNKIKNIKEANEIVNSLKICDPAVGSGHFLVSALNEIIAVKHDLRILCDREGNRLKEYKIKVVDDELRITDGKDTFAYRPDNEESRRVQEALFHEKQTIIENCLFGVDINPNSVAICRLRLWIELLKNAYYKNDTELETLPNIDINIKCGNSLVSRFSMTANMEEVLKTSKHTIKSYRKAIADYRNAKSQADKRDMENLIAKIKNEFSGYFQRKFDFENENEAETAATRKIYQNAFEWRLEFPEVLDDKGNFIRFDVVIGNPPYQMSDGGHKASAKPIYQLFVQQAKKLNPNYLTMIIPSRWFSGGKGLDDFRQEMLTDKQVRKIYDYFNATDVFSNNADIAGGVCYFLWCKDEPGDCLVTSIRRGDISAMERPLLTEGCDTFIRFNEAITILEKIHKNKFKSFADGVSSRKPFGLPTDIKIKKTKNADDVKIYAYPEKGYIKKTQITRNQNLIDENKVLISYAYGERGDFPYLVIGKPFLGEAGICCSETYIIARVCSSKEEAENVISYMTTRLFRFLVLILKNTQHATSKVYALVPDQDFSEPWTDAKLYAKYGLTDEETAFIESMVRPMGLD